MERNKKGQFVKGAKKNKEWYNAMEKRKGKNHSMYKPEIHKTERMEKMVLQTLPTR